jgi:hypothetical protein
MSQRAVYSVSLIEYTEATPNTSFEVPMGFTAVVREVDLYAELGEEICSMYIQAPGAEVGIGFMARSATGANTSQQWTGRAVVPENYTINLNVENFGAYSAVLVSGYLLTNN